MHARIACSIRERKIKNERIKKINITNNSVEFNIGEQIISDNGRKRVKEYGYFIAKIQESNMQPYLDKFNQLIRGNKSITIRLLEEDTFSIKRVRYNQGGLACYCMDNEDTGRIKEKNLWKPQPCNSSCNYLIKDDKGKTLCNRIAWLKFFIPEISTDRIWLMKITGQQSIDNLDAYLKVQKLQNNSLNGLFTLFLKQQEQTNFLGQIFNNYVLDIVYKDDFISNNQIPQDNQKQEQLSTNKTKIVNNKVEKEQIPTVNNTENTTKTKETKSPKQVQNIEANNDETNSKKQTKTKSKKSEEKKKGQTPEEQKNTTNEFENHYIFGTLSSETINTTNGNSKEYAVGTFYDMNDQTHKIIVKDNYATELQNCELGTLVEIDNIKEVNGRKFALDFKFIQKMEKNIAA